MGGGVKMACQMSIWQIFLGDVLVFFNKNMVLSKECGAQCRPKFISLSIFMPALNKSFILLFCHSSSDSFLNFFLSSVLPSLIHSSLHLSIHPFIHSSIHSCMHACMHSFIHSFGHSVIHSLGYSFMHSFMRACIHSFFSSSLLFLPEVQSLIFPSCHSCVLSVTDPLMCPSVIHSWGCSFPMCPFSQAFVMHLFWSMFIHPIIYSDRSFWVFSFTCCLFFHWFAHLSSGCICAFLRLV